ncbi:hypothetical protein T01_4855 [Trichinella spiralis]|uniref:Uncharacterized protein n=1 Tax=Trichinella spiralis TaxID=6334 RepID=A0A0V1AIN6_TRISP|nr:hypothetical protein T01_4855 [Trichinella spiralis]
MNNLTGCCSHFSHLPYCILLTDFNVFTYWNVLCHESPWILASD